MLICFFRGLVEVQGGVKGFPYLIPKSCLIHMVTIEMDQIFMHLAICAETEYKMGGK